MQSSEPDRQPGAEQQGEQPSQGGSGRGASTALAWLKLRESKYGPGGYDALTVVASADAAPAPSKPS